MTKILLKTYQNEYEKTDISIDNLCLKYSLSTKDLKGYTSWTKPKKLTDITELIDSEPLTADSEKLKDIIVHPKAIINESELITKPKTSILDTPEDADKATMEDIKTFKKAAIKEALRFIKDDAKFAEVKEFKDMVAIVDSIEKSYRVDGPTGPTINVVVQNLVNRFKEAPDDC